MRRLRSTLRLLSAAVAAAGLFACATTDEAKRDKPAPGEAAPLPPEPAPPGDAPPPPEPADEGADPTVEARPPPEQPVTGKPAENGELSAAKKQALARRSADGIDDETPLPTDEKSPARVAFLQAVEAARTDPRSAVQKFVEAAGKTTYFYAAWFNAGVAAERAGDLGAAERYYREALKIRPDYGPALVNLMLLLEEQGRAADATRVVDEALRTHADRAGPHVAAAVRAFRAGDLATTEAEALRAIRIDERTVPAMELMARVFFAQGRYETARFAIENALVLEPGNALLHLLRGHVLLKLKEEKEALEAFGNAARLRPELAEAQEHYGLLLLKRGDVPAALEALRKNVELRPKSPAAHLHLGNALRANKAYKEAEAAYKKALELDENLHEAHFNLALLYIDNELEGVDELDRLKKAAEELKVYEERARPAGRVQERVTEYRETLERTIQRLERRQEQERRRKLIEEAERKQKEAAAQAGGEGAEEGAAPEEKNPKGEDAVSPAEGSEPPAEGEGSDDK